MHLAREFVVEIRQPEPAGGEDHGGSAQPSLPLRSHWLSGRTVAGDDTVLSSLPTNRSTRACPRIRELSRKSGVRS